MGSSTKYGERIKDELAITWYALFGGESADGRGTPRYVGRTVNFSTAKAHYLRVANNPYSTGRVVILTDTEMRVAEAADFN